MTESIKQWADAGNIKELRYVFLDALDVDPTFEKYVQDWNYCKIVPGFLEEYREMTPLTENSQEWDEVYWGKLKSDLMKNFSEIRFIHMKKVARQIFQEKISRIESERQKQPDLRSPEDRKIKQRESTASYRVVEKTGLKRQEQEKELEEARRKLQEEEARAEEERRRQARIREEKRKAQEENERKKGKGIVLAASIGAVIVLVILILLFL